MSILGLDIGSSTCKISVFHHNRAEVIPNNQGFHYTPSLLARSDSEVLFGISAKHQTALPTESLTIETFPAFFDTLLGFAKDFLGGSDLKSCLLSSSGLAFLDQVKRKLMVISVIPNSVCAALSYDLDIPPFLSSSALTRNNSSNNGHWLFIDWGASHLELTCLYVMNGLIHVESTETFPIGGNDIDSSIFSFFLDEFYQKFSKSNKSTTLSLLESQISGKSKRRLKLECEKIKIALSSSQQVSLDLDGFHEGFDFLSSLSRSKFETLLIPNILNKVMKHISEFTKKHENQFFLEVDGVTRRPLSVLLSGGSSSIPKFQQVIIQQFSSTTTGGLDQPQCVIRKNRAVGSFDEVICHGLAIEASQLILGTPVEGGTEAISGMLQELKTIPNDIKLKVVKRQVGVKVQENLEDVGVVEKKVLENEVEEVTLLKKGDLVWGADLVGTAGQLPASWKKSFQVKLNTDSDRPFGYVQVVEGKSDLVFAKQLYIDTTAAVNTDAVVGVDDVVGDNKKNMIPYNNGIVKLNFTISNDKNHLQFEILQ